MSLPSAGTSDVNPAPRYPSVARLLARGLTRRCGRCGSGHLYSSWFRLIDRCPGCGYRFDREEGFFLGAFVISFAVTTGLLSLILGVMIAILANGGSNASITPIVVIAVAETVIVPVAFYPFSKTVWAAIDLALHRGDGWADHGPRECQPRKRSAEAKTLS